MKEKEGANIIGGGLRRETWIHPGDGRRMRRTTSAANEARLSHTSDLEELSQLTSVEVPISVSTSYLPKMCFPKATFSIAYNFRIPMTKCYTKKMQNFLKAFDMYLIS